MIDQDALQAAIFNALDGVPGMPPVYDDVPENVPFPYVVIGDDVSAAFDDDCGSGADSMVTIHVWSTYPGRAEAKQILDLIARTLHRSNLVIAGNVTITIDADYQMTLLDPDGVTRHGVIRFRVLTREIQP